MIIEVPLFIQTNQFNSGPTCLKMVLAHFGEHFGIQVLEKRIGVVKGKRVNSIQLVAAAASLGYGVSFYSKSLEFNEDNNDLDFYKKYNDLDSDQIKIWIDNSKKSGAILNETKVELADILSFVSEDSIPIVLVDWNVINDREEDGYQGNFVPVIGYDHKYVYVHNGGYNDHKANIPIEKDLFDKARKARGTDEDTIIIFRKGVEVRVLKNKNFEIKKDAKKDAKVEINIENKNLKKQEKKDEVKIKEESSKLDVEKISKKLGNKFLNEKVISDVGKKDYEKSIVVEEKKEIIEMEKEVSEMKKKIEIMKERLNKKDFKD